VIKKKLQGTKHNDPDWITEIAIGVLDIKINDLSEKQKKMLRETYLENIRDGMKPKEAIEKAVEIVKCFNQLFLI
jgi:hypothetical protein